MAKDLNRSIKIYIDHSDAMKKASDFANRIDKVNQKLQDLNAQGKKESPEYKKTEAELKRLTSSYDRYQAKLAQTERVLKNLSGATRGELETLQKELKRSLKDVAQGTDEYKAKVQALIAVEKQLSIVKKEQNGTLGKNATMWSRAADGFNKYFGIAASVIAGITGLSFTLRKLSEDVAKMDDVYSDVMKTTGMTRDEVLDLNDVFKKMDTRTARDELNLLARDAGKLGLESKKDILDFVEGGNQINVALGEDLGEGAIKNIGKMTDVYAKSTKELEALDLKGKMLAIGSAINELGASSTASEAYMVSFTQRLGGVAAQAGISIQDILGYASALDQSGQAVEMSATAMQKFIMKLMEDPAKFAKLAGLEVKAFNELLQQDTNAAMKQVLTALADKGGFQALIPIFKDMGLDGARAVGVLSALATNIDKVNTAQTISNKAFTDGTSITDEYNIKNNNLNAQLEKARKNFKDASLELGESLNPVLLTSTKWTTYLIKALPTVLNFFEKYGKYLLYISVVGGAYVAGMKLQVLWNTKLAGVLTLANLQLKLKNGWLITTRVAVLAYNAALALVTGNTTRAAAAWKLLNTVMKTSWLGIILAGIAALGIAIYTYTKRTNEAITSTKRLNEVHNEANRTISAERSELNLLLSIARNEKISKEERLKAIKRLNEISPEYLGNLKLENINTQAATESVKQYTEELLKNARAKAIQDRIANESDKMLGIDEKILEKRKEIEKLQNELDAIDRGDKVESPSVRAGMANKMANETIFITRLEREKKAIQETMDTYTDFYQDLFKSSSTKKEQTEFQKLNVLLQEQADIYNRIENNKNSIAYSVLQKKQDEVRLQMLVGQIEAQKELAKAEADRKNVNTDATIPTPEGTDKKSKNNPALDDIERRQKEETTALVKEYAERKWTKEEYEKKMTEIEAKFLNERFELTGLDADKRAEIEKAYYDFKAKLREKEDADEAKRVADAEKQRQELEKWNEKETEAKVAAAISDIDMQVESEQIALMDKYASKLISEQEYQDKLLAIEQDALAKKLRINGLSESQIQQLRKQSLTKQISENEKAQQKAQETAKAYAGIGQDFATQLGNILTDQMQNSEASTAEFQYNMLMLALDTLRQIVLLATAEAIAKEIGSKGIAGIATGAAAAAAINIAFAAVKGLIKKPKTKSSDTNESKTTSQRVVSQQREGKYDVIGSDDGKLYKNVPYAGAAATGIVKNPTLISEDGGELVVSSPDLKALQKHVNYPLIVQAINDVRAGAVPQRATGKYDNIEQPNGTVPYYDLSELNLTIKELNALIAYWKANGGIPAIINIYDLAKAQELVDDFENFGKKV